MPEWHAAPPRNAGAAAGFGAAVIGRGAVAAGLGAGKGCCASAVDEKAKHHATAAIAIRMSDKGIGIEVTGWRKFPDILNIVKPARKEMRPEQRSLDLANESRECASDDRLREIPDSSP